jgi:hypothetical protein
MKKERTNGNISRALVNIHHPKPISICQVHEQPTLLTDGYGLPRLISAKAQSVLLTST